MRRWQRPLAHIREEQLTPALASMVFVTRPPLETPSGRYVGAVHFQQLLRAAPTLMVATMLDHNLEPLKPRLTPGAGVALLRYLQPGSRPRG